jgi:uncharacterized protein YggE
MGRSLWWVGLGALLGVGSLPLVPPRSALAVEAQLQLRCEGALINTRGMAQLRRSTNRLAFSLGLEAEAADADAALTTLQQRLAGVRTALQRLEVQDLRVSSPSTWSRPAERNRPASTQANLQVTGQLASQRLQALVRDVGALPGVRLAPVSTQADPKGDAAARRQVLREAFADARSQALELATVAGFSRVMPLELRLDDLERPVSLRAMAAPEEGFNPNELPPPTERLSMAVAFCAI